MGQSLSSFRAKSPRNVSRAGRARRHPRGFIGAPLVASVLVFQISFALARDASTAMVDRLPAIVQPEVASSPIPLSKLDLQLTGTVRGEIKLAVISVNRARDEPYRIGDIITPTVQLIEVGAFSAVISHNGARERLTLNRQADATTMAILDTPKPAASGLPPLKPSARALPAESVQNQGGGRFSVRRSVLDDQLRTGDLFAYAKMIPVPDGGFRIVEIAPGSLYDAVGLKDGDTINVINGKRLESLADVMTLFEESNQTNTMQIEVIRNGGVIHFRFDFY